MKEYIVLVVTDEAGDDGSYHGSVIGAYDGSIVAKDMPAAIRKLMASLSKRDWVQEYLEEEGEEEGNDLDLSDVANVKRNCVEVCGIEHFLLPRKEL